MRDRPIAMKMALRGLRLQQRLAGDAAGVKAINLALRDPDIIEAVYQRFLPLYAAARGFSVGELGDGQLLERFQDFMEWVLENGPAIVEFIMMLISIFAEEQKYGLGPVLAATLVFICLLFGVASPSRADFVVEAAPGDCPNGQCATVIRHSPYAGRPLQIVSPIAEHRITRVVTVPVTAAATITRRTVHPQHRPVRWGGPVRRVLALPLQAAQRLRYRCQHR